MSYATWFTPRIAKVSRAKGRSAVAAAAYRLGAELHDERTEITHDYSRKRGIMAQFTLAPGVAPAWAEDAQDLWNHAEAAERRSNSVVARELLLPLPASIPDEGRLIIAEETARYLVDRYGVAVSVGVHEPDKHGDERNFHAHMQFTTRVLDETGFGAKTRVLDDVKTGPQEITAIREACARFTNAALEEWGSDDRVSADSYETRGEERLPTRHLGPAASEMERRGEETSLGNHNRDVEHANGLRDRLNRLVDELGKMHARTAAETAERYEEDPLLRQQPQELDDPEPTVPAESFTLHSLHQHMLVKAAAEVKTMAAERVSDAAGTWHDAIQDRAARVGQWWQNMRESFVGWRDHLQESVTSWWERHHQAQPEQQATPPPAAPELPQPPPSVEPSP